MTSLTIPGSESPFDRLKHIDPETGEAYWLAREVMQAAGYVEWRNFAPVVAKGLAMIESLHGGIVAGQHILVQDHEYEAGFGTKIIPNGEARLTRYGAYAVLVHSAKPEISEYFVMQAMYAENVQKAELTKLSSGSRFPSSLKTAATAAQVKALERRGYTLVAYDQEAGLYGLRLTGKASQDADRLEYAWIELERRHKVAESENENDHGPGMQRVSLFEKISRFFTPKQVALPAAKVALPPAQDATVNLQKILAPFAGITIDRMQLALSSTLHESYGMVGVTEIDRDRVVEAMSGLDPSTIIALYHAVELQYKDAPGTLPGFSLVVRAYREGLVRDGLL